MVFEDEMVKTGKVAGRFSWVFKLFFFFAVLFAIGLGVLSMMGGKSESLQRGAEQYLSMVSGMTAQVGQLNYIGIFPTIIVDAEDIVFKSVDYPKEAAHIEKIYVSTSFWNVFFGTGKITALEVKDVEAKRGVWGPRPLSIRKIAMEQKGPFGEPAFVVEGDYGNDSLFLSLGMDSSGKLGKKSYFVGEQDDFSFKAGTFEIKGVMSRARDGGLSFDMQSIGVPEKVAAGTVRVLRKNNGEWQVDGEILAGPNKFEVDFDIGAELKGDLYVPVLDLADLGTDKDTGKLWAALDVLLSDPEAPVTDIDLDGMPMELDVKLAEIKNGDKPVGTVSFALTLADNALKLGPFSGKLNKGDLSGDLVINAKELPASFETEMGLVNWVYANGSKEESLKGKADFHLKMEGKGRTYDSLWHSLSGTAAIVGGEGHFESAAMKLWGTGLLTSMVPEIDKSSEATMNCMIAVFNIKEGIAESDTVFMDMKRLTITGKGEIDIPAAKIDMKLKPDSKGVSLGDVSVPVRISGNLFSPSIGADTLGLGLKLGQLFLGTINPAFWAYSMADLGLTEDHPCHRFVEEGGKMDKADNSAAEAGEKTKSAEKREEKAEKEAAAAEEPLVKGDPAKEGNE